MDDRLTEYKSFVARKLQRLKEILASYALDDYSRKISMPDIEDDEFTDIFVGVDLVIDDLLSIRTELDYQNQLNRLKADMWKLAVTSQVSEHRLIDQLLNLAGPCLNLNRVSYYSLREQEEGAVCIRQWCSDREYATLKLNLPVKYISRYLGSEYVIIQRSEIPVQDLDLLKVLESNRIKSFLAMPNGNPKDPDGMFTFSDCSRERKWLPIEIEILSEMAKIVATKTAQLRAEEALRRANQNLEYEVRQRTLDLANVNRKLLADIQERQRVQQALEAETERLSVTLRSIDDAVIAADPEMKIVLFNKAAEQLTGRAQDEAAGKPVESIVKILDEKTRDLVKQSVLTAGTEETQGLERRGLINTRGDSERVISYHATALHDRRGESIGTVIVIRDVTERERLEDELFRIRKLESVGLLAGGIAHDFNNILTGIITNLFLARMSAKEESLRLVSEAERAAYRASKLTKQLLTFSKGGAPVRENASLRQMIEESVGFCLSGSSVDYRLDMPENLQQVYVDKGQIDQVLNNIIINADQAMTSGGTISIKASNVNIEHESRRTKSGPAISPLAPGEYVKVSISDEGEGILKSNLDKIFDPYFTTKENGTGLGLTTAFSIIRKHGGYITVDSRRNHGSTFTFYLPAARKETKNSEEKKVRMISRSGSILIMDDDTAVRTVVEKLLARSGYAVQGVSNGHEALRMYQEAKDKGTPFNLVIMDLTVPGGMGGKVAVKKLREIDPAAKVIVFSGYSNDPIMANYREYGFDGVIAKPFTIDEFTDAIDTILV